MKSNREFVLDTMKDYAVRVGGCPLTAFDTVRLMAKKGLKLRAVEGTGLSLHGKDRSNRRAYHWWVIDENGVEIDIHWPKQYAQHSNFKGSSYTDEGITRPEYNFYWEAIDNKRKRYWTLEQMKKENAYWYKELKKNQPLVEVEK